MSNEILQTNDDLKREHDQGRNTAVTMASFVYVGAIIAATGLFVTFVLTAFPETAYASRAIMVLGAILVGGSAVTFPVALHKWAVTGKHRSVAIGLYYGEIAILALNTVVSFAALLFKNAGTALPGWVAWYEPVSIVSIVYVIFAWGTIFLGDPKIRLQARQMEILNRFDERVAAKMEDFLDSYEGEDAIMAAATHQINERLRPKYAEKRHFGTNGHHPDRDIPERTRQFNYDESEPVPTPRRNSR